jgi:hypothetical protein
MYQGVLRMSDEQPEVQKYTSNCQPFPFRRSSGRAIVAITSYEGDHPVLLQFANAGFDHFRDQGHGRRPSRDHRADRRSAEVVNDFETPT